MQTSFKKINFLIITFYFTLSGFTGLIGEWKIINLTENKDNDFLPAIDSGGNMAWRTLRSKESIITITAKDNNKKEYPAPLSPDSIEKLKSKAVSYGANVPSCAAFRPAINVNRGAWAFFDGEDYEIQYLADGKIKIITENKTEDAFPVFWNDKIIWCAWDGNDYEIMMYDNGKTSALTKNEENDYFPACSEKLLIWQQWDEKKTTLNLVQYENGTISFLDRTKLVAPLIGKDYLKNLQHMANFVLDINTVEPAVYDQDIVFIWKDMDVYRVAFFDNKAGISARINTDNSGRQYLAKHLAMFNKKIVFSYWNSAVEEYDLFFWKQGMNTAEKIIRQGHDSYPALNDTILLWQGFDGADWEIFKSGL